MGSNLVVVRTASFAVRTAAGPQKTGTASLLNVDRTGSEVVCDDTSRRARRVVWCLVGRAAAMVRQAEHFIPSSLDFYNRHNLQPDRNWTATGPQRLRSGPQLDRNACGPDRKNTRFEPIQFLPDTLVLSSVHARPQSTRSLCQTLTSSISRHYAQAAG